MRLRSLGVSTPGPILLWQENQLFRLNTVWGRATDETNCPLCQVIAKLHRPGNGRGRAGGVGSKTANLSEQLMRAVICIAINSVMIEPLVTVRLVNPLKKNANENSNR